jgi:hypothetical protein
LRTVQRWYAGRASPYPWELQRLVTAVHPRDPALAGRLAEAIGQTLEGMGIGATAAPAPAAPPPPLPPATPLLVEAVVAAAAEALDVSPRVARPAVLAAVARAKAAALSIDDLLAVLGPPAPAEPERS